ncbi:MAG: T9SS type A sorting domain-containing protein [Bacteroidales bacterium]|nr:T9SS type A sorting domain-containing protein [Bacteroidales bacterium]
MKKALQLLCTLLLAIALHVEVLACDAPTNLRFQIEQDVPGYGYKYKVTLSWDAVDGADFYSLYFYSDNYPNGMWLGDTDGLYYVAGANTESVFQFAVLSHCSDGSSSEQSEKCTVTIQDGASPCLTPSNLNGIVEEDVPGFEYKYKVTLTWDAVDNAEAYQIFLNNDELTTVTTNSYEVGFQSPMTLQFAVATVCADGESPLSPYITVKIDPCMPPTNLKATVEEDVPGFGFKYKVTLTWDAFENASSYTIYENGVWKAYSTTSSAEFGYNTPATVYYNVTSSCEDGESDMTDPLHVVIGGNEGPCLPPTNLGATIEKNNPDYTYIYKVTMIWDAVEGAQAYYVYINGQEFGMTTTNYYIAGSDVETSFQYEVYSVCANGESEFSEPYTVNVTDESLEEYANRFEIYPNPANNYLNINTTENINEINIYNIVGVLVYSEKDFNNNIDLSNFSNGVYFIKINTDKGEITKKFIKQ